MDEAPPPAAPPPTGSDDCGRPPPSPPQLTEEERLARKMAALQKQDRRGRADAKVLFGADYQAGKRELKQSSSSGVFGVLLPGDVGGVNLKQ